MITERGYNTSTGEYASEIFYKGYRIYIDQDDNDNFTFSYYAPTTDEFINTASDFENYDSCLNAAELEIDGDNK